MDGFIDYPEYIEKYPEKSYDDWDKYQKKYFYDRLVKDFEEEKNSLSSEEFKEAEKMLSEMKSKL